MRLSHSTPGGFSAVEGMVAGPLRFAPGSAWQYSNTNYIALGRVVEVVSGESYDAYVRKHVFTPARMYESTTIGGEAAVANRATGYWRGMHMNKPLVPAPSTLQSWTWSAGDIVSTAGDIARWNIALASGNLISRADYALMLTPARLSYGKSTGYGFHWWSDTVDGHPVLSGLGDTYGFSSCTDVFPRAHVTIVVLENMAITPDGDSDAAAGLAAVAFGALQR
jgi:D-alanyl-D-alanine carboxypeptidase